MQIKRKRTLFFLVLFVILSCLFILLFLNHSAKNYTVKVTDHGFEPDKISIRKGDSINFLSIGKKIHWPAVNPHPQHTTYKTDKKGCIGSILDACRGLKNGDSFFFTFENEGIFGMHDHLFPGFLLTVKVSPRNVLIVPFFNKVPEISGTNNPPTIEEFRKVDYSQKREIIKKLSMKDPKYAWKYLKTATFENDEVVDNVHEFAHQIGHEMYKKYGLEGVRFCSKEIIYGCYHGLVEKMLLTKGINSIKEIETECMKLYPSDENGVSRDPGCVHGIGHGVLLWDNLDLKKALKDCDLLKEPNQRYCYNAVFMELSVSGASPFPKNSNKWKLCEGLNIAAQKECASYIPTLVLKWNLVNIQDIVSICKQGPNENLRERCLWAIGYRVAIGYGGNLESILADCNSIKDRGWRDNCLIGAAQSVSFQHYRDWKNVGDELCAAVLMPDFRKYCIELKNKQILQ